MVGEDYAPPAYALARRGIAEQIQGFSLFGPEGEQHPASKLIDAVERGEVDVAIAWGPLAGYFALNQKSQLDVTPVTPATYADIPFTYDMSAGVRKGDEALRSELDRSLVQQCLAVQAVLDQFHVPQIAEGRPQCESSQQHSVLSR